MKNSPRCQWVVAAFALTACHVAAQPAQRAIDVDEQVARALVSALAANSSAQAEAHFDQTLRTKLPPPALNELWQRLEARHGKLASWDIAKRDHLAGKARVIFELRFAQGEMYELVALDPRTHEVAGLFFQEKERPARREEPASVGPLALPGTWTFPAGTGPFPAALLVGGSGPHDRDEAIGGRKPLRDLAWGLAERGIATLRYDKRTFAHLEWFLEHGPATAESEVTEDAVAALELMRQRAEVERTFVIGHSLGALLAPEIAQRGGGVAGLVLLGAPGRPVTQVTLDQLEAAPQTADIAQLEHQFETVNSLPADTVLMGAPVSYWLDLNRRDEMSIAIALGKPVLLLRGSLDRNVLAVDQERWLAALTGKVPVTSLTFPGLNHLFMRSGDVQSKHVTPEVIDAISHFLLQP